MEAWAKSKKNKVADGREPEFGLSLVDHVIDVAAVGRELLSIKTVRSRLGALANRSLENVDIARLAFFIGLHDIGKANVGFQNKVRKRKGQAGHILPIWSILKCAPLTRNELGLISKLNTALKKEIWSDWFESENAQLRMWSSVLAHHGSLPTDQSSPRVGLWRVLDQYDPFKAVSEATETLLQAFGESLHQTDAAKLPVNAEFINAFSGYVTLADWLGSDQSVFLYPNEEVPTKTERIRWSSDQAHQLLINRWLNPDRARSLVEQVEINFSSLFPGLEPRPRPAQSTLINCPLPMPGQIVVLEAETGSGKTEAALIHFLRLYQAGKVDGMYFALPTRAAAKQIHRRIYSIIKKWFGDGAPPVALAVPGYFRVDESDYQMQLPNSYDILWPDEMDRDRSWTVENSKRYLSGAIVVGTIDQVLLGGLRVRHATLRSGPMLRLLLCIDEVHASDSYMVTILKNVLEQVKKACGHALLMSATLGDTARTRLLVRGQVDSGDQLSFQDASKICYPSLQFAGEKILPITQVTNEKVVSVTLLDPKNDYVNLIERVRTEAESGAVVLFIRNTVQDAQTTVRDLSNLGARLFRCNGIEAPHHSRFATEDRHRLDEELERAFRDRNQGGIVAVTTQTAEQSLDICADWLVTDIVPGDVLLQRIGRLHRHLNERPEQFQNPQVSILAPPISQLELYLRKKRNPMLGLGSVYENIVSVVATRMWLEQHKQISIPKDNRSIVESATHDDHLHSLAQSLGSVWIERYYESIGGKLVKQGIATANSYSWSEGLEQNQPIKDAKVATRLGLSDRSIRLKQPCKGPFNIDIQNFNIPSWMIPDTEASSEPTDIEMHDGHSLTFTFGGSGFRYDRFGLVTFK